MTVTLTSHQVADLKDKLAQGLYWEALDLTPQSTGRETKIRLAELEQACSRDQDALRLLSQARAGLLSNKYSQARELCDEFFGELGSRLSLPVFDSDALTRAPLWQGGLRPALSGTNDVRLAMAKAIRSGAIDLANEAQGDGLGLDTALTAVDKSLRALEIAQTYAAGRLDLNGDLRTARELKALIYCNHGARQIDRAQERLKDRTASLLDDALATGDRPPPMAFEGVIDGTIADAERGLELVEKAAGLDPGSTHIRAQLDEGRGIIGTMRQVKAAAVHSLGEASAARDYGRGVDRINEAQQRLKSRLDQISQSHDAESFAEGARAAFDTAAHEIRQGIEDLEQASRKDPRNRRAQEQMNVARKMLRDIEEQREEAERAAGRHAATALCNRGVQRINEAQEKLQEAIEEARARVARGDIDIEALLGDQLGGLVGHLSVYEVQRLLDSIGGNAEALLVGPMARGALEQAKREIAAAVSDIEEARRLDPSSDHVRGQLDQARKLLQTIGETSGSTSDSHESAVGRGLKRLGRFLSGG